MSSKKNLATTIKSVMLMASVIAAPALAAPAVAPTTTQTVQKCFDGKNGVFVLRDTAGKTVYEYNKKQVSTGFAPCSTFKIFLGLVALETGAITDPNKIEKWDGSKEPSETGERDHNLQTAMRDSVNWYFQKLSAKIGPEELKKYVQLMHYGNEDLSSGKNFWMGSEGSMRITPEQQVEFLERLYAEKLPISAKAQRTVKRILQVDQGPNGVLFGKTGTDGIKGKMVGGWFVGFVEGKRDNYIFATHIDGPDGASGRKAREISKAVLQQLGVW
jgi:bla regulator protein BlaR1